MNIAMQDALELSTCLLDESFADTQKAIAAYEKQMRVRASEIANRSLEQTVSLHSADAIANMPDMFQE